MTLRNIRCGALVAVFMGLVLGGTAAGLAQQPSSQPALHPESQEALERLLRLRDEMERQKKSTQETPPGQTEQEVTPPVQPAEPPAATVEPEPQVSEEELSPEERRRRRMEELRAKARASTQRAEPEARESREEEPKAGEEDFVGPTEELSNNPPQRMSRESEATTESEPVVTEGEPERERKPKPLRRRESTEEEDGKTEWFEFSQKPWEDVIMHFVERIGKPLMESEDMYIGGELTYVSEQRFTKEEALDELNLILHEKGYLFVERKNHIYLIPLSEMGRHIDLAHVYPTVEAFEQANPRDMEYVTVYYRVPDLPAEQVLEMFDVAMPDYVMTRALQESNQIEISALARDVRKFLALKAKIDISPLDPRKIKFFDIKTNAREIERLVRDFMNLGGGTPQIRMQRDPRTGRMVPQPVTPGGTQDDVQMVADDRTNSIIVKATEEKMKEIADLIEKFDQKPDIGEFDTKVIEVEHADAVEVANLLNQIFQQEQGQQQQSSQLANLQRLRALQAQARQRGRRGQPAQTPVTAQSGTATPEDILAEGIFERAKKTIRLVADQRMNALIVYANKDGHDRVKELLTVLDKPQPDKFKTIAVEHADVATVGPMLTQIVAGMSQASVRGRGEAPQIVTDETSNVFHVFAEPDDMARIEALIAQLDVPGPEQERHVVRLKNLRPSEVAQMVQTLLSSGGGSGPDASSVRSSINRRMGRRGGFTPTMTTTGAPDYQVIPLDDAQILIVYCPEEDWGKVEETINLWDDNALTNTPSIESFKIEKGDPDAIAAMLSDFYRAYSHPVLGRSSVAIQAESDMIWVYGVKPAIEEIASLIESLDVEHVEDRLEILPLVHADAQQVAQLLQQRFGAAAVRRGVRGGGTGGPMIQADAVTNSLIIQAGKAELEEIMDFALRMDQQHGAQQPEQRFITPRYATPRDVATAVAQMYAGGGQRFRGMAVGSQIKAVATPTQVVIEAPAEKMAEIEAFIRQLDDPQGKEIVIKSFKLEGADVGQIARKLTTAYRQKANVQAVFDADPSSETILVTCNKDALEEIEALIIECHQAAQGVAPVVEFRQMQYATAVDAANWLRDQLVTYMQTQLGRQAAQQIKVTADPRTNRVVINAPNVAVEYGKKLLEQFDVEPTKPPIDVMVTYMRKLPGLDVRTLAANLDRTFRERPRRPDGLQTSFTSDALTETIIVSAPKDMADEIDKLIGEFAKETEELTPEQKFIVVAEADANYVAGQLRELLVERLRRTRGREVAERVSITVDTRLNRLVINAPASVIPMAEALVAELDQPSSGARQLRTIALMTADANAVFGVVRQIFDEKIRARTLSISVEPMTNSLIVGGTNEDFEEIEKWARELDEQSLVKRGQLKIVDTLNANPWEIVNILNAQYGARGYGRRQQLGQEYSFSVISGRSIVVQAPEDKLPDILELIERLDNVGVDKVEVRTYELPGIGRGVHDLARELTQAMNQTAESRERRVSISPYEAADTLIVTARTDQFPEIEEMMDKFKAMVEKETTVTKFIELQYLDAGRYAGTIQNMLANKLNKEGQRTRATQSLSITPDPRTNRLICYVPEKIVPDLEEVIAFLDVEPTIQEGELRTIELAYADAGTVANILRPMFEQTRNERRQQDFSQIVVRIQAEPITNSLIVMASDEDFEQIQRQAIEIDEKAILQGNEPQVVALQYADPNEMVNLINNWFGRGRGGRGANQSQQAQASVTNGVLVVSAPKKQMDEILTLVREVDTPDPSGMKIRTFDLKVLNATQVMAAVQLFLKDVKRSQRAGQLSPGAYAEPTTNTLVVIAPGEQMPFIEALITDLEAKAPKEGKTREFVLKHVRAEQVANNVDAMLKAKIAEREGNVRQSVVRTAVFAESTTNRLFIYAPEDYMDLAANLVEMIDREVESTDIVHIISLEEADAQQLLQSVNQIIQGNLRGSGSPGARSGTATVRVSADTASNSLILAGMAKDVAEVEKWIKELEGKSDRIPELQTFALMYANSATVEETLQAMFGGGAGRRGAPAEPVTITADEYTGKLTVTANRRVMRRIEQVIAQLDQAPTDDSLMACGRQLYFVDINRGSASDIAWDVRDLLPPEENCGPSIEADWFDKYLIVKCRPSEFPTIEQYIRQFERRYKPELAQRVVTVPAEEVEGILTYLSARFEDKGNLVIKVPQQKPKLESLIVDVWGEGETPPGVSQERRENGERRQRLAPFQSALPLAETLLPKGERSSETRPADGGTIPSPVEKIPTQIVWQEDGRLRIEGATDDVDDLSAAIDLFLEERTAGEVIRIFRFRYGDVNAAAEILSIMFDVRRQQIVVPQPQQRRPQQGQGERGDDEEQRRNSMFEQLQSMVGGRQRGQQGSTDQLRMATDPGHNYLIVKCDQKYIPEIHQLLRELDIPPGKVELKVFQLHNLLAEETAENIKDVLGISKVQERRGRPTPQRGRGGNQQQQLMEMLQQQMVSVPGVEGGAKVERVEIVPNAITNSLMVSAPPEVMGLIENVIKELENLEGRDVVGIHHYALEKARVDDVLPLLQEIFSATGGGGGPRGGRGSGGSSPAALGSVVVSGDPRTNTVIFTCENKDQELVEAQIAKLDIEGVDIREIDIVYADPVKLAATLSQMFGGGGGAPARGGRGGRGESGGVLTSGQVMIMGDKDASKLLVRAPDEIFVQIEEVVATLDHPSEQMKLQRFQLRYADAEVVVESVKAALAEYVQISKGMGDEPDLDPFTAMADPRTNSITVVGTDKTFLFVNQVLAAVDVRTPEEQRKEFRIFPLEKADAATVADAINGFAAGGGMAAPGGGGGARRRGAAAPSGGGARELNVSAVAEATTNSVLVFGRLEDIEIVRVAVIEQLESTISDRFQIATIPVKNVPPSQVIGFIYQFMDQTGAAAGGEAGGEGGPQIVPNDNGKSIIVRGTSGQITEVRELVERFDDPDIGTPTIKVIPVPPGQDAVTLAGQLQQIVNESEASIAAQTGRRARQVTVGADDYTNSIVLAGEPTLFGLVESIVAQLAEVRNPAQVTRVIEFRNLSADDAAEFINKVNQERRGGGSSGARRSPSVRPSGAGRSSGQPSGGGRSGGRRGMRLPSGPPGSVLPSLGRPPVQAQPFIGVMPLNAMILLAASADDEEPVRLGEWRRVVLAAAQQEQQPASLGQLRREALPPAQAEPEPQPEEEPAASREGQPEAGMMEGLTGVSGSLRGEVTATAVDSRRLIITGDEDDVEFIEQVLRMMEASAPPAIIEVFTLEHAKAAALAPIIDEAVKAQIEARTKSPGPQDRFSVNAEARSNSLIVSASEQLMGQIALLVEQLDVDRATDAAFKTVALQYIRAVEAVAQLKPVIENLMQQREIPKEAQVTISALERSNSVMIVGTPKDVEEVVRMVEAVDVKLTDEDEGPASFVTADVVMLPLQNNSAEEVAKLLTDMIEEQQENARQADPEKPGAPFVKLLRLRLEDGRELPPLNLDRPIKIIAEKGTNSLLVFSSKDNTQALAAIVDVFDTLPLGENVAVKAFVLRHASAEEIATLIEDLFKEKPYLARPADGDKLPSGVLPPVPPGLAAKGLPYPLMVQHDARSNTVVVVGREDAVLLAGGLISELDRPTADLGLKAYVLELKYMQATQLAEKLEELLKERATALGGDKNEARDSAIVKPEERTNSLLVFATPETYEMIEDLVLELDGAQKYSVVDLRYHALRYADAAKLQGFLQEMFDAKLKAEKETNQEVSDSLTVMADARNNALLMTGTRDYLAEAEALIRQLDQEGDATIVFRAIQVKLNSAANIAALLKDMVDEALTQQDSKLKGTPIHIAADPISDSLLLAAAREDMALLERWVEILDRPSEVGRMTKIIPLRRAPAEDVSKAVQDVFKRSGGEQSGQVDLTVTSDKSTNAVVAFGPPALLDDIELFVRQLDATEAVSGVMVKMFKLEQADAEDAGDLLTRILDLQGGSVGGSGGGGGGGSQQEAAKQVMLIYQEQHPELGMETLKGWREDIIVISDLRTNSLVIEAPPESMPLMESLVAAIDVPPDAAKIRVFRLRNADAEQMVETLKELFERETVGGERSEETERELVLGEGMAGGGRQEIAFTSDVRTNSVIAAGTPGYLDIVEEFVLELDTIPIDDRETFVYSPRNIPAEELATSLRDFSEEEQSRLEEIGDEVSLARRQERKIVAISNEESNRIIFDVDPRFRDAVMQVVRELDQPPPQVMIQVLIVEVAMDNELDLGVEFAFQDLQWAQAGVDDTTTFDYVGGTDLGAAGSGLGGFTFTITGADFNFLFRTLQNEGDLQVLSRPQIVAMDNQEAYIDVSDDVPYVTGTATTTGGVVTTSVARERIGIKLTVTPQINPDGFVRMELTQEVSDFTGSTVDVGQGVTAPTFFRREAKTVVSVRDNETVVLGGLITSRKENREQKIPIIGDIPGLGLLFRNQNDINRRAELLIVMTPHIIRNVQDFRDVSTIERDRLTIINDETLTDPLMQGLQVEPGEAEGLADPAAEPVMVPREPSQPGDAVDEDMYGPLRPALRPEDVERRQDRDTYDVPLTLLAQPR